MSQIDINDYKIEKDCVSQDEKYRVRDNGAVLRCPKNNFMNEIYYKFNFKMF